MYNKKGYIMVYAIGMLSLLMLIAATLTSITFTRSKWARNQIDLIQDTTFAKAQVEAASSDLANYFENINNSPKGERGYLNEMIEDMQEYFNEIRNLYNIEIIPDSFMEEKYSYELLVRYCGEKVIAEKKIFLSMMPSYLFFALGSNTDININGGTYIDGNMYINNEFYLANTANYILNDNRLSKQTSFSTIKNGSSVFYSSKDYKINSCYLHEDCFDTSQQRFIKQNFGKEDINLIFNNPPIIRDYPNNFLNVDFDEAFIYYLEKDIITKEYIANYPNLDINNLDSIFLQLYEDGLIDNFHNRSGNKSTIINDNYVITDDLDFTQSDVKKHWIIVNGNLEIKNYDNNNILNINANFLVNGNITITGFVKLDSTIYSLGEGLIHNASINVDSSNKNDQLVLLTKENLKFSKINEFDNRFLGIEEDENQNISINPIIKGYFYTDSFVEIYTVNSYLVIEGGVFSNDNHNNEFNEQGERIIKKYITNTDSIGLLINSFQGEVIDNDGSFNFINYDEDFKYARFIIKHDTSILETQPKGLPLTKDFNYLFEDTRIIKLQK